MVPAKIHFTSSQACHCLPMTVKRVPPYAGPLLGLTCKRDKGCTDHDVAMYSIPSAEKSCPLLLISIVMLPCNAVSTAHSTSELLIQLTRAPALHLRKGESVKWSPITATIFTLSPPVWGVFALIARTVGPGSYKYSKPPDVKSTPLLPTSRVTRLSNPASGVIHSIMDDVIHRTRLLISSSSW